MNVRETLCAQLFSQTQSKLAVFAVADNLCIKPGVRNLKPYLKYTETHHVYLDSVLRYSFRKDKYFFQGFIILF